MTETYDVPQIKARLLAKMGKHAGRYPAAIEQFSPRILARIADLWGSAGLDFYLESLMLPERQERRGFPVAVATELFKLTTVHAALGLAPKIGGTGWAVVEESARDGEVLADDK
jgi:hypothetical protein